MYQSILKSASKKMSDSIEFYKEEIKSLRTSKANTSIMESIKVSYYGTLTSLIQLAQISSPDKESIIIDPFDKNSIKNIEKAIYDSDLNLTPTIEGQKIRIKIPPLTQERRQELLEILKQKTEQAKISTRSIREDVQNVIKELESTKKITEDEKFKAIEELNKITNDFSIKIDQIQDNKSKDISTI